MYPLRSREYVQRFSFKLVSVRKSNRRRHGCIRVMNSLPESITRIICSRSFFVVDGQSTTHSVSSMNRAFEHDAPFQWLWKTPFFRVVDRFACIAATSATVRGCFVASFSVFCGRAWSHETRLFRHVGLIFCSESLSLFRGWCRFYLWSLGFGC
jgi:hypothetical protein